MSYPQKKIKNPWDIPSKMSIEPQLCPKTACPAALRERPCVDPERGAFFGAGTFFGTFLPSIPRSIAGLKKRKYTREDEVI